MRGWGKVDLDSAVKRKNLFVILIMIFSEPIQGSTLHSEREGCFSQKSSQHQGFSLLTLLFCHHSFSFLNYWSLGFSGCFSDRVSLFVQEYLQGNPLWLSYVKVPLVTLGYETTYDVFVKAHGGGLSGQSQAISLGIARALLKVSEDHRKPLRKEGLLTRDSRVVERKKVGLKKARKAPQFSKRWMRSL